MSELALVFELNFDENKGCLGPAVAASTFSIPAELSQFAEACLPADRGLQTFYKEIVPQLDGEYVRCADCLVAMKTTGDGDCLLHAVMLSLCGVEDTTKIFRQLLVLTMTSSSISAGLQCLWHSTERKEDANMGFPDAREDVQLMKGYEQCVSEAAQPGCFLGPFHVACLSNILCRPIVVYADEYVRDTGGAPFSDQSLRGIYLPVLRHPDVCHKRCIVLLHSASANGIAGHFTALIGTTAGADSVADRKSIDIGIFQHSEYDFRSPIKTDTTMKEETEIMKGTLIPLVDKFGRLLPLRFPAEMRNSDLSDKDASAVIRKYVDLAHMPSAVHCGVRDQIIDNSRSLPSGGFYMYAIQRSIRIRAQRANETAVTDRDTYAMTFVSNRREEYYSCVNAFITKRRLQLKAELANLDVTEALVHNMSRSNDCRHNVVDSISSSSTRHHNPVTNEPMQLSCNSVAKQEKSAKIASSPGIIRASTNEQDYFITSVPSPPRNPSSVLLGSSAESASPLNYGIRTSRIETRGTQATCLPIERFQLPSSSANYRLRYSGSTGTRGDSRLGTNPIYEEYFSPNTHSLSRTNEMSRPSAFGSSAPRSSSTGRPHSASRFRPNSGSYSHHF